MIFLFIRTNNEKARFGKLIYNYTNKYEVLGNKYKKKGVGPPMRKWWSPMPVRRREVRPKERISGVNDPGSSTNGCRGGKGKRSCSECKRRERQVNRVQGGVLVWNLSQARNCRRHFSGNVGKWTPSGVRFYYNQLHPQWPNFQMRSYSEIRGVRMSTYLFFEETQLHS